MSDSDLTLEGLVHDLSNVFETIQEAAEVLSKDPKHARMAAALRRSVARGERILSSFAAQSQAELDVETIVQHAIEFARDSLAAVKGPRLEFVLRVEDALRLRGNPAAWERVFVNLFLNSAQAMGGADGVVEIDAKREDLCVSVTVSDNGPGISPQNLPRLFQPGFSTRAKRSGLGLHIVKTIVEKQGGTVEAANRPGGGAQFRVALGFTAGVDRDD